MPSVEDRHLVNDSVSRGSGDDRLDGTLALVRGRDRDTHQFYIPQTSSAS